MDIDALVDAYWAKSLDLAVDEIRRPGVRVIIDAPGLDGYRGVYLLQLHDSCFVAVPAELADAATKAVRGHGVKHVFDRSFAETIAAEASSIVLGPSWHGYRARCEVAAPIGSHVRRIGPEDGERIDRLEALVGRDSWAEGGFVPLPETLWGIDDGDGLACLGNMTDFDGWPADVGLVTRPDARGRGLATSVARAMCAAAPPSTPLLRYRALATNVASLRVAAHLGFRGIGANIAVRRSIR